MAGRLKRQKKFYSILNLHSLTGLARQHTVYTFLSGFARSHMVFYTHCLIYLFIYWILILVLALNLCLIIWCLGVYWAVLNITACVTYFALVYDDVCYWKWTYYYKGIFQCYYHLNFIFQTVNRPGDGMKEIVGYLVTAEQITLENEGLKWSVKLFSRQYCNMCNKNKY